MLELLLVSLYTNICWSRSSDRGTTKYMVLIDATTDSAIETTRTTRDKNMSDVPALDLQNRLHLGHEFLLRKSTADGKARCNEEAVRRSLLLVGRADTDPATRKFCDQIALKQDKVFTLHVSEKNISTWANVLREHLFDESDESAQHYDVPGPPVRVTDSNSARNSCELIKTRISGLLDNFV